jgi:hypothetical protein
MVKKSHPIQKHYGTVPYLIEKCRTKTGLKGVLKNIKKSGDQTMYVPILKKTHSTKSFSGAQIGT